jgi:TPR repeat protein
VALAALPNLKIILPAGVSGRSNILITLVTLDGAVLAEAKSVLDVAAPAQQQATRSAPVPPDAAMLRPATRIEASPKERGPAPPAGAAWPMASRDRERAQRLMEKGNQELEGGNVSAARLFYEYAADVGLADAAMALAATFDVNELAKLNVRGIKPDAKEAERWYERARQLGATEADQRVRRLSGQ